MSNILHKIKTECSNFIEESKGNYAQKSLYFDGRFVKRVKVRKKKIKDNFSTLFDEAFEDEYKNIHRRSIFCNGPHSSENISDKPKFYVFSINGYKFLYNPDIDYHKEYMKIYDRLKTTMDTINVKDTFKDMIEYSYKQTEQNLENALFSENEIIFYNIPYYYAVKKSKHPDYSTLLKMIMSS